MVDVRIDELPRLTRLAVRGDAASFGTAFGVALPVVACRASVAGERAALWLGPDEWLVLAPDGALTIADLPGSVVDVSHRQIGIEIAGPSAALALNAFCALDLHPTVFPPGSCTRTVFGKAEIVLWHIAPEVFRVEVARSFAPYLRACLELASLEFGGLEFSGREFVV
jgi:heterotetrameric sarcosine oxidase gamma subunit